MGLEEENRLALQGLVLPGSSPASVSPDWPGMKTARRPSLKPREGTRRERGHWLSHTEEDPRAVNRPWQKAPQRLAGAERTTCHPSLTGDKKPSRPQGTSPDQLLPVKPHLQAAAEPQDILDEAQMPREARRVWRLIKSSRTVVPSLCAIHGGAGGTPLGL